MVEEIQTEGEKVMGKELVYSGIATAYIGFAMLIFFNKKDSWIGVVGIVFGFAQIGYAIYSIKTGG